MKGDETPITYLTKAQDYFDALANNGKPINEQDLVMLVISGLWEEYSGLKSTLLSRENPIAFSNLYRLLDDHDYLLRKNTPSPPPVQAFTATTSNRLPLISPDTL